MIGYLAGKALGQGEVNRRAIAIEVGMQNSGLGVALATAHFGPLAALPSVLAVPGTTFQDRFLRLIGLKTCW